MKAWENLEYSKMIVEPIISSVEKTPQARNAFLIAVLLAVRYVRNRRRNSSYCCYMQISAESKPGIGSCFTFAIPFLTTKQIAGLH